MSDYQVDYDAISRERAYAEEKWGTDFDDKNTLNDWITYAGMYATDAARMGNDTEKQYSFVIKAAALLCETARRIRTGTVADRHYEGVDVDLGHGAGRAWKAPLVGDSDQ